MTTPESMKEEFSNLFGEKLTIQQLWLIVKICKYVRLRARNNSAFNNLMNKVFPYARFFTTIKRKLDGSTYPGLSIGIDKEEVALNIEDE